MSLVDVPGHGQVEFPDTMNDDQIVAAIKQLTGQRSGLQQVGDAAANVLVGGPVLGPIATSIGHSGVYPRLKETGRKALESVPGNAKEVAGSFWDMISSPLQTAKGVGQMAGAIFAGHVDPETAAAVAQSSPENQTAFAEAQKASREATQPIRDEMWNGIKDAYGSPEAVLNRLETKPVSMAMDVSSFMPGVAPINMAGRALGGAGRAVESVASHALGTVTGAGPDSVRAAGRAGLMGGNEVFTGQLNRTRDINEPVTLARRALVREKRLANAEYRSSMEGVNADTSHLDFRPVVDNLSEAQRSLYHGGIPDDAYAVRALNKAEAAVNARRLQPQPANVPNLGHTQGLDEHLFPPGPSPANNGAMLPVPSPQYTAQGFDRLKKSLGEIFASTREGTNARRLVGGVYNHVKDEIVRQRPEYARIMAVSQAGIQGTNEARAALSLGERASADTALRKLQSTMRDTVASNFGGRKVIGERLAEHEPNLPYALAGQMLHSPIPRGLTGRAVGIYEALHAPWLLPFTSPRVVGTAAYGAGHAARPIRGAYNATAPAMSVMGGPLYEAGNTEEELRRRGLLDE